MILPEGFQYRKYGIKYYLPPVISYANFNRHYLIIKGSVNYDAPFFRKNDDIKVGFAHYCLADHQFL